MSTSNFLWLFGTAILHDLILFLIQKMTMQWPFRNQVFNHHDMSGKIKFSFHPRWHNHNIYSNTHHHRPPTGISIKRWFQLFSCPEQLNKVTLSLTNWLTVLLLLTLLSDPTDLWSLTHLIRVIRRHDLTEKDFRNISRFLENFQIFGKFPDFWKNFQIFGKLSDFQHHRRAFLETCGLRLDTWDTEYISDNWEQQY